MTFEELYYLVASQGKPWTPADLAGLHGVSFGVNHAAGLRPDGTVAAFGDNSEGQLEVGDWRDIIQVSCGKSHTVGLRRDGTVVGAGSDRDGQLNIGAWHDIVSIATPYWQTVGVRRDGTTVDVGFNYDGPNRHDLSSFENVAKVFSGSIHVLCLCRDGMVMGTGGYGFDPAINEHVYSPECVTGAWFDIVDVACGKDHSVGLARSGRIYTGGPNDGYGTGQDYGQLAFSDVTDGARIAAAGNTTILAHRDGRIEARGFYRYDSLAPELGLRRYDQA